MAKKTGSKEINSDSYALSSCSHVAAMPEGAVRISITDGEGSARQIADDFVRYMAVEAFHKAVLAFWFARFNNIYLFDILVEKQINFPNIFVKYGKT